jgi:hypothetical protein
LFFHGKIEEGVFSMKHNKVSWPDGFLIGFYHNFSDLLADDIFRMFSAFYEGKVNICRFKWDNHTYCQREGAGQTKYKPICLLNVVFNFFTKVLNNRAIIVEVISKIQSAFLKGRFFLDGVAVLHETIHYIQQKSVYFLKLTLKKYR